MQVLEIITDACLVKPDIGIGACICRSSSVDGTPKTQILKGVWLFNATASFEAEIMTGIKTISKIKANTCTNSQKMPISWSCDLSYLGDLLKNSASAQNLRMKELLEEVRILTKHDSLEVSYPERTNILRYHNGCHRICSAIRQTILESENKSECVHKVTLIALNKYRNWSFLGCDLCEGVA